jgi:hypothetical protein
MRTSFKIMQIGSTSILFLLIFFTVPTSPLMQNQHAYSQPIIDNSTLGPADVNASNGVDLIKIHTSPSNVKVPNKFEIISTVVNKSPSTIMFNASVCDSPLSAKFLKYVVIRHTQGCTATSPPFKLKSGEQVTVAGPSSGTTYQAFSAGQTTASVTLHYQTENGQAANVTKPFVFTINS